MPRRILFAWELGGGSGHLAPHRPLVDALCGEGHEVLFATRNPAAAQAMYPGCRCVAAPAMVQRAPPTAQPIRSYAQILQAGGFDDAEQLGRLVAGWRRLLLEFSPDLAILDHAPGALVALRGQGITTVTRGTGFFHPPDVTPLPDLRPWLPAAPQQLADDEDRVVRAVNRVLSAQRAPGVRSVACLFRDVDAVQLTTYAALDPYRQWPNRRYVGACPIGGPPPPPWPAGRGPRAFCYLSPSRAASVVLRRLVALGCPTLVFLGRGTNLGMTLPPSPLLTRLTGHVDLQQVAEASDFAVLEGNHFSTVEFLREGKPILQIPRTLEQTHMALATQATGGGIVSPPGCVTAATVLEVVFRFTGSARRWTQFTLSPSSGGSRDG